MSLVLQGLPKMTNGSNKHWRSVWAERKKWRRAVAMAAIAFGPPKAPLEKAKLTLTRRSSVAPDGDGLISGFKSTIDGLCDAGVLVNDRLENIGIPTYVWEQAPRGKGSIQIEVRG